MPKLTLDAGQQAALLALDNTSGPLEDAFGFGVDGPGGDLAGVLDPIYQGQPLDAATKIKAKNPFMLLFAAILRAMNIKRPFPSVVFTGTVVLPGSITAGSITVVDGLITAYTPPT